MRASSEKLPSAVNKKCFTMHVQPEVQDFVVKHWFFALDFTYKTLACEAGVLAVKCERQVERDNKRHKWRLQNAYTVTERVSTVLNGSTDRGPIDCGETYAIWKLQKLQNRAARVLTHSSFDADAGPLFEQLKWCPLARRRESHMATMVYKSLNRLVPKYLQHKFVYRNSQYSLRDSINRLALPLPRANYLLKSSFKYSGAVLRNSLPAGLRQAESLNSLNRAAKSIS